MPPGVAVLNAYQDNVSFRFPPRGGFDPSTRSPRAEWLTPPCPTKGSSRTADCTRSPDRLHQRSTRIERAVGPLATLAGWRRIPERMGRGAEWRRANQRVG